MRRFSFGVALGVFLAILVPLLVIAFGVINFAATSVPSSVEVATAKFAVGQSMSWCGPNVENPFQSDNLAAKSGFHHYANTCLTCHGDPNLAPKEFANGLNPPAPNLIDSLHRFTDSELFWMRTEFACQICRLSVQLIPTKTFGKSSRSSGTYRT